MGTEQGGGISRRDFAKMSALAGFAVLSARGARAQADALKVGLIGCGGRGTGAAFNCLDSGANVKITALADVFEDRLKDCRKKLESHEKAAMVALTDEQCFVGLDAYAQLLKTDVDVIMLATPPYARPIHFEAAVNAGKHIFTEKPVAVDATGIRRFMEAARKAGEMKLSVVAGTQRRHQSPYIEGIKRIHDGDIGEIVAGRAYWNGDLPFSHARKAGWSDLEYRLRNWYNQCWTCGDNILEQHVHNLDVINWALNAHPVKVVASGGRAWKPLGEERYGDIWDNFTCDYEYPNGVHVLSMSRHWNNSANGVFEQVTGTKGKSPCRTMRDTTDPYVQEHTDLYASILGGGPYLNEGVQVAESCLTAIMGRMAAYTGQEIKWDDALNSDENIVPAVLDFDKEYPLGPIPVPGKKKA